ncbi:MAG: hypothetical protein AAGA65_01810 [Actinomycetota bacterium]
MTVPGGTERLAEIVGPVAERFQAAGHRLYLVGGVVRDLAIAAEPTAETTATTVDHVVAGDIDLTTDAGPTEIRTLIAPIAEALWTQGERFGTIGATVNGQPMEITTHRAEAYDPESRKPIVTFGDDLGEDLSRRDFTINAMAIEVPDLALHDPYDGLVDLHRRLLRTPLSPEVSFTDDPLRMLRASRFITRFGLTPSPELVVAATDLANRLAIVSVERVTDELERLLATEDPAAGLHFLITTGLLPRVITAFDGDEAAQQQAVALAAADTDRVVRRAGLLWPVRSTAAEELSRLRYPKAESKATTALLAATDRVLTADPSPSAVRRLIDRVGGDGFDRALRLANAVTETTGRPGRDTPGGGRDTPGGGRDTPGGGRDTPGGGRDTVGELRLIRDELAADEDLDNFDPPLTGAEIMAVLGIGPGPVVGRAAAALRDHRLDVGPLDAESAIEVLRAWWRQTAPDGKR